MFFKKDQSYLERWFHATCPVNVLLVNYATYDSLYEQFSVIISSISL